MLWLVVVLAGLVAGAATVAVRATGEADAEPELRTVVSSLGYRFSVDGEATLVDGDLRGGSMRQDMAWERWRVERGDVVDHVTIYRSILPDQTDRLPALGLQLNHRTSQQLDDAVREGEVTTIASEGLAVTGVLPTPDGVPALPLPGALAEGAVTALVRLVDDQVLVQAATVGEDPPSDDEVRAIVASVEPE